jgi:hypothetical protein
LYSCLAHGNAEEFQRGEILYRTHAVKDVLQVRLVKNYILMHFEVFFIINIKN